MHKSAPCNILPFSLEPTFSQLVKKINQTSEESKFFLQITTNAFLREAGVQDFSDPDLLHEIFMRIFKEPFQEFHDDPSTLAQIGAALFISRGVIDSFLDEDFFFSDQILFALHSIDILSRVGQICAECFGHKCFWKLADFFASETGKTDEFAKQRDQFTSNHFDSASNRFDFSSI